MRSNFIKLEYELITLDNLNLAISIQGVVFPGESATEHYKVSIRTNYKSSSYYIIKMNCIPVGITGIYILNLYDENVIDKDDVWLGWYGILPEFRSRGIEKQSLLDTIEIAKRFNRKYFRLYTNNDINSTAYPLYEKVMSLREVYRNFEEDKEYVDKYAIYSCSFNDEETEPTIDREYCEHLLISFGDDHVTFKECDGYDIKVVLGEYSGQCSYFIENDDIRIMEGVTFDYNYYYVDHKNYESDVKSLQKK